MGKRLRRERELRRLTRERLAESADIDPSTIRRIEGASRSCAFSTLIDLANALGVGLAELMPEATPRPDATRPPPRPARA
ncbi:MAG: helix-turn-helix domain-containing protein [Deltaproteobacteria bacterium]